MMDLAKVLDFARTAHGDQKRKYTLAPYIEHPMEVAELVRSVTADDDAIAAALLHDVVEDTPITISQIRANFGDRVARFVAEVTDISRPQDGNRATRKAMDREHLAKASPQGQTIKLADLISNAGGIMQYDRDFAKVYIREKRALLEVLTMGDHRLYDRAMKIVEDAEKELATP